MFLAGPVDPGITSNTSLPFLNSLNEVLVNSSNIQH